MNIKRSLWIGLLFLSIASANGASLFDKGDSTVIDLLTGLTWVQTETNWMTWEAALTYCEGLSFAGKTDWRLPNVNELESIVDFSRPYLAINTTYFPGAGSFYWTSTTDVSNSAHALEGYFYDGSVVYSTKTQTLPVRCVR